MSSYSEAVALHDSLPPTGAVAGQLVPAVNALLAAAKEQNPDSISVAAFRPIAENTFGYADIDSAGLRTMMAVVAAALKPGIGVA